MGIKMKIKYFNVANLKFYETFKIKKDKVDIIMNNIIWNFMKLLRLKKIKMHAVTRDNQQKITMLSHCTPNTN
jgi:hypothetical protein